MTGICPSAKQLSVLLAFTAIFSCSSAHAAVVYWTDWTTQGTVPGNPGSFVGNGVITTPTSTVNVTYTNLNGISFYQPSGGTDYWINNGPFHSGVRDPSTSPYTSTIVDNIPTGTDIIALQFAGSQTLTFSQPIANPVFSYVSLNGNGYGFINQDFDILSYDDPATGRDCGYWGCGTSFKQVVDLGGGNFEYELLGTGEPHGTIRFKGSFSSVTWQSLSSENWNGFTVGIQGTSAEVFGPEPSTTWLLGTGVMAMIFIASRLRRRNALKQS
jgi:hypothetical protein